MYFKFMYSEVVFQRCSVKKVLLKISQNSQKTAVPKSLFKVFSCEFYEVSKNIFFYRTPLVAASASCVVSSLCSFKNLMMTENSTNPFKGILTELFFLQPAATMKINPSEQCLLKTYLLKNRSNHERCSIKKVFLEISQNSQENTCARVSFLIKLQALGKVPVNFAKFLRIPFLQNTSGQLLLKKTDFKEPSFFRLLLSSCTCPITFSYPSTINQYFFVLFEKKTDQINPFHATGLFYTP